MEIDLRSIIASHCSLKITTSKRALVVQLLDEGRIWIQNLAIPQEVKWSFMSIEYRNELEMQVRRRKYSVGRKSRIRLRKSLWTWKLPVQNKLQVYVYEASGTLAYHEAIIVAYQDLVLWSCAHFPKDIADDMDVPEDLGRLKYPRIFVDEEASIVLLSLKSHKFYVHAKETSITIQSIQFNSAPYIKSVWEAFPVLRSCVHGHDQYLQLTLIGYLWWNSIRAQQRDCSLR